MQWLIDIVFEKVQALLSGTIIMWSGTVGTIPDGWVLCDGNNDTPDLRNSFVIGAGDTYNPDDSGGDIDHTHNFTSNGHAHLLEIGSGIAGGVAVNDISSTNADAGTTGSPSTPPPYYALAYIMKT